MNASVFLLPPGSGSYHVDGEVQTHQNFTTLSKNFVSPIFSCALSGDGASGSTQPGTTTCQRRKDAGPAQQGFPWPFPSS